MSWRIIYIEDEDYLSLYLDNVRIKRKDREVTVPLSDINTIMVDNLQATFSASLINKCAEYNISIITCDHRHLPQAITLPSSGHYRASAMLHAQLSWTELFRAHLWQYIVRMKILHQARVRFHHQPLALESYALMHHEVMDMADWRLAEDKIGMNLPWHCEDDALKMIFSEFIAGEINEKTAYLKGIL